MTGLYAVLLDGAFLHHRLKSRLGKPPLADDIVRACRQLAARPELASRELLRAFYYHARPCAVTATHPISRERIFLGDEPTAQYHARLFAELQRRDNFAVRLGDCEFVGWKLGAAAAKQIYKNPRPPAAADVVPDIRQKGVDMRIGMDISWLAMKRLVDVLVVATGDSDFIPALKLARREGLRVYLETLGHGVLDELKAHVDLVF